MLNTTPSRLSFLGLFAMCGILFFWQLDAYSLFNETEAKQAEIARQIWVRQDWLTPYYNGEIYFDKPILLHWLIACAISLVGLNEWAVRLPSAIAATLLILGTWMFIRSLKGNRVAILTAIFLAANPFTFALGRTGQHDMLLTCCFSLALYGLFLGYATGGLWEYLGFFAAIALATLAKGPIAIVLSGLILVLFLALTRQWHILRQMPWRMGSLLFGSLVLPWYGLMVRTHGWIYLSQFLGANNLDRFLSPNLQQSAPGYFYLVLLVIGFFPWNVALPGVILRGVRLAWLRPKPQPSIESDDPLPLFMVIWFVTVVGFMSLTATKLPWYVYPGLPALAYLCAQGWNESFFQSRPSLAWPLVAITVVYLGSAVCFLWFPQQFSNLVVVQAIRTTGITSLWATITLIAGLMIGVCAVYGQVVWCCVASTTTFMLIALTLVNPVMPVIDQALLTAKLQPIVEILMQEVNHSDPATLPVALGIKDPSLNFYSRIDHIERLESPLELLAWCDRAERLLVITKQQSSLDQLNLTNLNPIVVAGDYRVFKLSSRECQDALGEK